MSPPPVDEGVDRLAPDDAFALLGNETRLSILQAIGDAVGPLTFSALREAVGVRDSGQFNYHLEKLAGTFVEKTDEGYLLREAGRRVVEAIYSGVLTEEPPASRIQVERPCAFCGAPTEVRVVPGAVEVYCTDCAGAYGSATRSGTRVEFDRGYLGRLSLPPAGFQGRTPEEAYRAAQVWGNLEILSIANGVCPRCSAALEHDVAVCPDHDAGDGLCTACGQRYAATVTTTCTNCIFDGSGMVGLLLYRHPAVQAFKTGHGFNLVAPRPGRNPLSAVREEIVSVDPFAGRYSYEHEGDTLVLDVDADLKITVAEDPDGANSRAGSFAIEDSR